MADTPTFVFDDDGKAYAYLNGKVVASADDADELELKLANEPLDGYPYSGPEFDPQVQPAPEGAGVGCETCGNPDVTPEDQFCSMCGSPVQAEQTGDPADPGAAVDPLPAAAPDTLPGDDLPPRVTHVETPNGLKGQILGKVKGLWGDQVTIRLENGRIAKFDVTPDLKFTNEKTASVSSPYAALEARLSELPDGTKDSLKARIIELKKIKHEAASLVRTANYVDQTTIHNMIVTADHELREVTDALAALEDAEPYAAPAPFNSQVVEQESVGGGDATWLDNTLGEMIQEAENTDFDQMISEDPEVLVAELETPALEDAAGVQEYALSHVNSKTAGLDRSAVAEFTNAFLARVEAARKVELDSREEDAQMQQREASANDYDGPDEALFF